MNKFYLLYIEMVVPFVYTEEEYRELANELEYVRTIKDSAEKTLKEVREDIKKLKSDLSLVIKERDDNIKQNKKLKGLLKEHITTYDVHFDEFEKNEKLKHKNELQEKALIKLCLKHHYDSIIIEGEEVIDMSNYKVVEKKKPQEEKLF